MRTFPVSFPLLVLVGASVFFLYDILVDMLKGTDSFWHLLLEGGVFVATSIALYLESIRVIHLRRDVLTEQEKVYRLTGKLYDIIHRQFDEWQLSDTEKEIAILLIKGYSMREISELRNVKEKTIRHQATSIYAKAGYANRNELASHFIQDLINTPSPATHGKAGL